ncbi:hypothetical protein [Desulfobacca acetoxidans]|uniref:Uncharacterized protein n=1 Tax=Desulfobacca acetoxidans (strain ATCC 700848 / DSM 11109 / ASRB2) TaxID=880072 RepID=F2NI99_DESAR|nr:hypothetical protein [Desulfobacca acetoxidans]AEB09868.1 hypothetical protein Desac_2039 [Desulfobacca acetoxidans DSM 11109]
MTSAGSPIKGVADNNPQLQHHFELVKEIIAKQDMLSRVPEEYLVFSFQHLEDLVKFAYFAGFIQLGEARQFLLLPKEAMRPRLRQWYEEIREKGCWLC